MSQNSFNYSPSRGVYSLGNDWYFESLKGSGFLNVSEGDITLVSSQRCLASFSYGYYLSPGHTAILIPQGDGVDLNVSYVFVGSPNDTVSTQVWVTDQQNLQKGYGGWYFGGNTVTGDGRPQEVSYSVSIGPGPSYFDVEINPFFNGAVEIKDIRITYSFYRVVNGMPFGASLTSHVKLNISVASGASYTIGIIYLGNGTMNINGKVMKLRTMREAPATFITSITPNSSTLMLEFLNVSLGGALVIRGGKLLSSNAFNSYNLLTASVDLNPANYSYLVVNLPYNGASVSSGKYLGLNAFGLPVFYLSSSPKESARTYYYIVNGFVNNCAALIFTAAFYLIAAFVFLNPLERLRRLRAG